MKNYYITTAIPYANAKPHIGTAMDYLYGDILLRYHTAQGDNALMSIGTDEHGTKVEQKAVENNETPQQWVDDLQKDFAEMREKMNLDFTHIRSVRTTDADHVRRVQAIWRKLDAAGVIYKNTYEGWYCIGCEGFVTETEAHEMNYACPDHNKPLEKLSEEKVIFRMKNNEGVYRSYEVTGKTQEYDEEGFPRLIIGLIIDDQERLEYEASLIEAKEKAEIADQLKSTFLANMTHEIRSPLHAIVGFTDLLNTESDPAVREEYMNLIKMNNDLLVRLINDILDISKIEADMMTFSYTNVNVPLFMKDIYGTLRLRMPDNVMLILDPCPDIVFLTDRSRLSQILINLITNAIKHTTEGSIRFGYQLIGMDIEFYVSDTGAGIPEDKLDQIFSRFIQLKGAKQGIGLGLAICKGLVNKLGGEIYVASKVGEGSTFRFKLPLYKDPKSM